MYSKTHFFILCKNRPKFVVISRANPLNPIVSKLKGLFNSEESGESNAFLNNILKLQTTNSPKAVFKSNIDEFSESNILSSLQSMANKYSNYVNHDLYIAVQIEEIVSIEYFTFDQKSGFEKKLLQIISINFNPFFDNLNNFLLIGNVIKINDKPNKIHINIKAKTKEDLLQFCLNQDMNCVEITSSLF
jgi:hypothetical protein